MIKRTRINWTLFSTRSMGISTLKVFSARKTQKITYKILINRIMITSLISIFSFGCTGNEMVIPLGIKDGRLTDCPASPNCISTQTKELEKHMASLPFSGSLEESRQKILSIVNSMSRSNVVTKEEDYLHIEFRSAFFRFVDDVEFSFDDGSKIIHFRSASRTGYSDFGVNRKRMTTISKKYMTGMD